MSINEISLMNPTDPGRPAENVLTLSTVGDLAFITVSKVDEGNPSTTTTVTAEMVVSLPTLRDALVLLCQDRDRERLRPKDERGELLADLAGYRYVQVPV